MNFFNSVRNGSPYFLYSCSLFVITNLTGILCGNILSLLTFAFLSVFYIYFIYTKKNLTRYKHQSQNHIFPFTAALTCLFSIFFENGILINIFNDVSDKDSNKTEMILFSLIVVSFSFLCATKGTKTLYSISNILFVIPFVAVVPCIFSAFEYGIGEVSSFFTAENIVTDILKGIATYLLFVSDSVMIYRNAAKENKNEITSAKIWMSASVVFICLFSILFNFLLGNILYEKLSSPLFAIAGVSKYIRANNILPMMFSICVLYRISLKIAFISNEIKHRDISSKIRNLLVFILTALFSAVGILFSSDNLRAYLITALCCLNAISYFLVPLIQNYKLKIK